MAHPTAPIGRAVLASACLLASLLLIGSPATAQAPEQRSVFSPQALEALEALDSRQLQRYERLTRELRCLVCQNQSVAESNAPLALDLREQVRLQILQGRSDEDIRDFMRQRYGDFVLYQPPVQANTLALWLTPLLLLALAAAIYLRRVRRAATTGAAEDADAGDDKGDDEGDDWKDPFLNPDTESARTTVETTAQTAAEADAGSGRPQP